MLTAVFLHGHLGQKYGEKLMLDVDSVAAAIGLLKANFKHFAKDVIGQGNAYQVWVGKTNVSREELANPCNGQDVHIVPVVAGAGGNSNVFQIILGIILIVVDFFTDYAFGGGTLTKMGIGLIVGGVAGVIMSSSIKKLSMAATERTDTSRPSRYFNGPVNTTGQGNPVPILYGRMMVGSQVVSGGLSDGDV